MGIAEFRITVGSIGSGIAGFRLPGDNMGFCRSVFDKNTSVAPLRLESMTYLLPGRGNEAEPAGTGHPPLVVNLLMQLRAFYNENNTFLRSHAALEMQLTSQLKQVLARSGGEVRSQAREIERAIRGSLVQDGELRRALDRLEREVKKNENNLIARHGPEAAGLTGIRPGTGFGAVRGERNRFAVQPYRRAERQAGALVRRESAADGLLYRALAEAEQEEKPQARLPAGKGKTPAPKESAATGKRRKKETAAEPTQPDRDTDRKKVRARRSEAADAASAKAEGQAVPAVGQKAGERPEQAIRHSAGEGRAVAVLSERTPRQGGTAQMPWHEAQDAVEWSGQGVPVRYGRRVRTALLPFDGQPGSAEQLARSSMLGTERWMYQNRQALRMTGQSAVLLRGTAQAGGVRTESPAGDRWIYLSRAPANEPRDVAQQTAQKRILHTPIMRDAAQTDGPAGGMRDAAADRRAEPAVSLLSARPESTRNPESRLSVRTAYRDLFRRLPQTQPVPKPVSALPGASGTEHEAQTAAPRIVRETAGVLFRPYTAAQVMRLPASGRSPMPGRDGVRTPWQNRPDAPLIFRYIGEKSAAFSGGFPHTIYSRQRSGPGVGAYMAAQPSWSLSFPGNRTESPVDLAFYRSGKAKRLYSDFGTGRAVPALGSVDSGTDVLTSEGTGAVRARRVKPQVLTQGTAFFAGLTDPPASLIKSALPAESIPSTRLVPLTAVYWADGEPRSGVAGAGWPAAYLPNPGAAASPLLQRTEMQAARQAVNPMIRPVWKATVQRPGSTALPPAAHAPVSGWTRQLALRMAERSTLGSDVQRGKRTDVPQAVLPLLLFAEPFFTAAAQGAEFPGRLNPHRPSHHPGAARGIGQAVFRSLLRIAQEAPAARAVRSDGAAHHPGAARGIVGQTAFRSPLRIAQEALAARAVRSDGTAPGEAVVQTETPPGLTHFAQEPEPVRALRPQEENTAAPQAGLPGMVFRKPASRQDVYPRASAQREADGEDVLRQQAVGAAALNAAFSYPQAAADSSAVAASGQPVVLDDGQETQIIGRLMDEINYNRLTEELLVRVERRLRAERRKFGL